MYKIRDATIRVKLSAAFAVALLLMLAVGLFSLLQLQKVNQAAAEMRASWMPRIESLARIRSTVAEHRLLVDKPDNTASKRLAALVYSLQPTTAMLRAEEARYRQIADTDEERQLVSEFYELWDQYQTTVKTMLELLDLGIIEGNLAAYQWGAMPAFNQAWDKLERLAVVSDDRSRAIEGRAHWNYVLALLLTCAVLTVSALCAAGAIFWVFRDLSRPILRVSEAMRRLSGGDLSAGLAGETRRSDEIGILMDAVAGYRESLIRSRNLADEAHLERERLQAAVGNMPIGLVMFDRAKQLIIGNDRYRDMYGLPQSAMQRGTHLRKLLECRLSGGNFEGNDRESYIDRVLKLVEATEPSQRVVELADGHTVSIIHQPMAGGGWIATHEDVTERVKAEARVAHMARHDALTDLPNRILFKERLTAVVERAQRGSQVAILCLDLDRFKQVNDTLGHPVGDALLRSVAARLTQAIRGSDTAARFGGDEFAIVQVGAAQPEGATSLAQRIIEMVGAPYEIEGQQIVIATSIGIAVAPADGDCAEQLLKNADLALYRAKADGRGLFRFFEPEMDAAMQSRRALELDLRRALVNGEFGLHYQPIINLQTGHVTTFEALLRWQHPVRGLVMPSEFIPLAEEIGLIVQIGEGVLRQACSDATCWPDDISVAVNLSPAQFRNARLTETVVQALAASSLSPRRLELEITEGVLLVDREATMRTLHQLRSLGIRIAMDDFGTGYSSIGYLRTFPFDKIKIDRTFIGSLPDDQSASAIVRAVVGLSGRLGMVTTAEGVETLEQLDNLRSEGCTEVQGFYFSGARPASEIMSLVAERKREAAAAAA